MDAWRGIDAFGKKWIQFKINLKIQRENKQNVKFLDGI